MSSETDPFFERYEKLKIAFVESCRELEHVWNSTYSKNLEEFFDETELSEEAREKIKAIFGWMESA